MRISSRTWFHPKRGLQCMTIYIYSYKWTYHVISTCYIATFLCFCILIIMYFALPTCKLKCPKWRGGPQFNSTKVPLYHLIWGPQASVPSSSIMKLGTQVPYFIWIWGPGHSKYQFSLNTGSYSSVYIEPDCMCDHVCVEAIKSSPKQSKMRLRNNLHSWLKSIVSYYDIVAGWFVMLYSVFHHSPNQNF